MRRLLGPTLLVTLLLAGCGDDGDDTASDPQPPEPAYDVTLLHDTAVGGRISNLLTPVEADDELSAFTDQFRSPEFTQEVRAAAEEAEQPYAAVVALGCDVPPGVEVIETADGFEVVAQKVADPLPECLAPVTTVAVVAISGA